MNFHIEAPESVKYHGGYDPSDPPQGEHWCSECSNWDEECECGKFADDFTGLICDLCGQWINASDVAREWSDDRGQTGRGGFVHHDCYINAGGPENVRR